MKLKRAEKYLKRLFSRRPRRSLSREGDSSSSSDQETTKKSEPPTATDQIQEIIQRPPEFRSSSTKGGAPESSAHNYKRPVWRCFSYEEMFEATNGFSSENLVGRGGCAEVYKGTLVDEEDGKKLLVAVKKLTKASTEEKREREFLTEIGTIGHVSHPNVCSLLGCCVDNGLFLVFQLSSGGSVASRLHDHEKVQEVLEWKNRYKIAIGAATGVHYLHKRCPRRIIHRDIKASNILLNDDFEPKISDFGLAKWLPTQWTHHSIVPIEGTVGCLAPEYFSNGIVDEKTDVFAFGVFLLELISGKRPVDASHQSLRTWAKPYLKQGGEVDKLVDPRLQGSYDTVQLKRLVFAASLCIRSSPTWRPTMTEVLEMMTLEGEPDEKRWEMPEREEEKDKQFWGFEALDDDLEVELECDVIDTSSSSFSTSINNDFVSSTGTSRELCLCGDQPTQIN